VLAAVCRLRATLAIAGTHGKTTTTSMLTLILATAGRDPSWLLGADVSGLGSNARIASGPELVLEADESYGAFTQLAPTLAAINNVEPDHLDFYGDFEGLRRAFSGLLERSEARLVNADDPVAADIGAQAGAATVGTSHGSDFLVSEIRLERSSSSFRLEHPGGGLVARVGAPGRHNVANASLAAAVALTRGVPDDAVVEALGRFAGVPRRFEFRGESLGATIVDDYAHLPTEVAVTVATAKAGGWDRVVAVFQPHRYTRTLALASQFSSAFAGADVVIVTDVYGSGEPPIPGVSGWLVAEAIERPDGAPEVIYVKERADLARAVAGIVQPGDLVLTMGAGDLTALADELIGLGT
jgi:UDP-N-acetylmuramate--alanine ligase